MGSIYSNKNDREGGHEEVPPRPPGTWPGGRRGRAGCTSSGSAATFTAKLRSDERGAERGGGVVAFNAELGGGWCMDARVR